MAMGLSKATEVLMIMLQQNSVRPMIVLMEKMTVVKEMSRNHLNNYENKNN